MLRIYLFRYIKKLFGTIYNVANTFVPFHQMILLHIETMETLTLLSSCVFCG